MAKNLAPSSRKWREKSQIGENDGERKINPSENPGYTLHFILFKFVCRSKSPTGLMLLVICIFDVK